MCLGVMPSPIVGSVYGLNELLTLGNAVKRGNTNPNSNPTYNP
jgi:hypothetical protein